jgi:hypothetical protein
VAGSIDALTQLASAANHTDDAASDGPPAPRTPAEHFDAFLDALAPAPGADFRLTLTSQVARLVDGYDQKTADDIRRRYREPAGSDADGYWDSPDEADGPVPE